MQGSMAVLNSDRHDDVPGMVDQDPAEKMGIFYRNLRTSDERFLKIRTIFPSSEISISWRSPSSAIKIPPQIAQKKTKVPTLFGWFLKLNN